jgi:hypothetical protein
MEDSLSQTFSVEKVYDESMESYRSTDSTSKKANARKMEFPERVIETLMPWDLDSKTTKARRRDRYLP